MDHIAIMKKSWGLIPKILSGEKTIESRWYQTRRKPWNSIKRGDKIFFKNSGEPVTAKAVVGDVWQFEIKNISEVKKIVEKFGDKICLVNTKISSWQPMPKYCVLISLSNPQLVKPFCIDKRGFGSAAAWLQIDSIKNIKTQ